MSDCLSFLTVDAVILNLPEDGVYELMTATDCFQSVPDLHETWAAIKQNLLVRLKALRRPLVINGRSVVNLKKHVSTCR